ncbi:MAG: porin family protein [Kangiellaceae bacterium]|nr:porin family protein [Kangiellaceae bacterium]MCW8997693.1 porin family protein [Kangiellaceae bacterium]MCW9017427.1 porin family protein [Kangiellaceae bacterium]
MKSKIFIGACLSLVSLGSLADSSVSNYVEVGYSSQEHDVLEGDYKGFELAGSYQLNEDFFVSAKYISTEEDRDLEFVRKSLGVGFVISADDDSTWYTQFDAVNVLFDRDYAASFDQNGFQLGFGYQRTLSDAFSFNVEISRLHARKVDDTFGDFSPTYLTLGGKYQFSDAFSVYGDFEYEDEGERATLGLRYSF